MAAAHLWRVETLGRQAQALHKDVELSAVHDPAPLKHVYEPVQPLGLTLGLTLAIGSLQAAAWAAAWATGVLGCKRVG